MDRDDNRARGERSLSEPGGSSVGHVLLSAAPPVCEATAVGTGASFVTALAEQRQPMAGLLISQPRRRWWEALQEFEGVVPLVPRDHKAATMLRHVRVRLN